MKKYKETLANLILSEIHRLKLIKSQLMNEINMLKNCDKETLAILIAKEMNRLNIRYKKNIEKGDTQTAKFFNEQIKDLEYLDIVLWQELEKN